ncbi:MAG: LysR substrate-binding domain-containing protein [Rhodoferax sp.]
MRRKIPSLQALSCFDAAARHESYSRAAQELALTQGAVSRQIAALESFLGLALFRRTRHGVVLTERGREYAAQVAPRLQALEQDTLDAMSARGSGSSGGTLRLAAVPTFATRWLIPRLAALRQAHPDLTVHLESATRPFLFADTPFDAALFALSPEQVQQWAGTQATPLMPERTVPVASPALLGGSGARSAQELAALPLLQQSTRPTAWRQWFEAQGVHAPDALAGARFEQFSMTSAAAIAGLGVALVPELLVQHELASGTLVRAAPASAVPALERSYCLVTPLGQEARAPLRAFASWLLGHAATG